MFIHYSLASESDFSDVSFNDEIGYLEALKSDLVGENL